MSEHLYLIDGSGYIFRAYHKLPPLTNPDGVPVGAVYGFTTMLWKLVKDLTGDGGPSHLAVVFDHSSKSFRNDMYGDYKANRPPPPEDLVPQFPLVRDAVRAFSLPCLELEGFEADDIIASYTCLARAQGMAVTIVSSDKDLMQLVGDGVDMLDTLGNRRIGVPEVIEKWGVGPEKLGEVLALMGDSVDNVPGVPGIGPKFAADLVNQFGDVETLLGRLDEVKRPKQREALTEHADKARLSRELVRLHCEVPLPQPVECFVIQPTPPDPLREFLSRMGFRSLVAKVDAPGAFTGGVLPGTVAPAGSAPPLPLTPEKPFDLDGYELILDRDRLRWWAEEGARRGALTIDTETDELGAMTAGLCGISLALEPGHACYIPLDHRGEGLLGERPAQLGLEEVREVLGPVLADVSVRKTGQNIKYDLMVLARHGLPMANIDDTMLMSYALDAGTRGGHGMDELSEKHLGHVPIAFKDVCGTGAKRISFAQVDLARATRYAAEDADVTCRLAERFRPRLSAEGVTRVYELIDRPLIPVIAEMEMAGVKVDRAALAGLSQAYGEAIVEAEVRAHAAAGGPFNIGSVKQLGEVLFERLKLPGGKRSAKSGQWTTDETVLQRLAEEGAEVAERVLEWRQLTKLKSTYTDALQAAIHPKTGRVHTCFGLATASTGRLSSTDPNLQNIPIRTELGRRIRDAFVAEPGNVLIAADYNQIELRLIAHMADETGLIETYARGEDVHARTACELFGVTPETMTREHRARAKTINFSIIYGISAFGLAGRLGIPRDEAADYIGRYFSRYPGIRAYMAERQAEARSQGFVTTLFGRKCHVPQITSKNQAERGFAERVAINAPVQGTAADIIKRAMARMPGALRGAGLKATRMLLQVHDELVFEGPDGEAAAAIPVIRKVMAEAAEPWVRLNVPLGVEIGTGISWGAAH